jgi:hypothetical protein
LNFFKFIKPVNLLLIAIGIDLAKSISRISSLPNFLWQYSIFCKKSKIKVVFDPIFEKNDSSANLGEYFFQDLYVSRKIIESKPEIHYDVGSRVDGFISILSTHLKVKVLDIRPLDLSINNVSFQQLDIVNLPTKFYGIANSLSCLHTLEHIGLGRYGDPIGVDDWINALSNLKKLLSKDGMLYISTPIGKELVRFNSNRIFSASILCRKAIDMGLALHSFAYLSFSYNKPQMIFESIDPYRDFEKFNDVPYSLGIFIFKSS